MNIPLKQHCIKRFRGYDKFRPQLQKLYTKIEEKALEVVEERLEDEEDLNIMIRLNENKIFYAVEFYNGGTYLDEMIEDSLNKFDSKENNF